MIVRNVPIDSFIAAPVFLRSKKATSIVTRGETALWAKVDDRTHRRLSEQTGSQFRLLGRVSRQMPEQLHRRHSNQRLCLRNSPV